MTSVTFNGTTYYVPAYNEKGWAQGSGNVSLYLIAIAQGTLQTTGGTFTLSADANFGASFGLKAVYFKSASASIATAGVLRLAAGDSIEWSTSNYALGETAGALTWRGNYVVTSASGATPVEHRDTYTAGTPSGTYTGSLSVVDLSFAYVANGVNLKVYLNGLLCALTLDYTETSTTRLTFGSNVNTGDRIDALATTY